MSLAEDRERLTTILGEPAVASLEKMIPLLSGEEKTRQGEGLPKISSETSQKLIKLFGLELSYEDHLLAFNRRGGKFFPVEQAIKHMRDIQIPLLRKDAPDFEAQFELWLKKNFKGDMAINHAAIGACLVLEAFHLAKSDFVASLEQLPLDTRLKEFKEIKRVTRKPVVVFDAVDQELAGLPAYQEFLKECINRVVSLAADEYNTREGAYMTYRLLEILWEKRTKEIS